MLDNFGGANVKAYTREEFEKMCASEPFLEMHAREIEDWPDFSFTTMGGQRTFSIYLNCISNDTDSIEHRLRAKSICITRPDQERLQKVAGFILETGTTDPPLIFSTKGDLQAAWLEHHSMFSVKLSSIEREIFQGEVSEDDEEDD